MAKSKGPTKTEWHTAYEFLSPVDAGQMRLVGTQRARQQAAPNVVEERAFVGYLSQATARVIIIIGGIADRVVSVTRPLTIWSVLVLGVGAACMVLIRAYMVGLLGETMMFGGVFTTLLIAMLIGLRVTTAARRAQIEIMRMPLPEWMTEEG